MLRNTEKARVAGAKEVKEGGAVMAFILYCPSLCSIRTTPTPHPEAAGSEKTGTGYLT